MERGRPRRGARARIGRCAVTTGIPRAASRVSRWPRPRTPSRWAGSGRPAGGSGRPTACTRGWSRRRPGGSPGDRLGQTEQPLDVGLQQVEGGFCGTGPGDEQELPVWRSAERMPVENRLDPAPHAIADDRVPNRLGDGDSDLGFARALGGQQDERGSYAPLSPPVQASKLASPPERTKGAHTIDAGAASDREPVAPLLAARGQHAPTVFGPHALEKPVDALAATVVRLEGPLHLRTPYVGMRTPYCIGGGGIASRNFDAMRIVLTLSTPVEKPVDNVSSACLSKPYPVGIPAVRTLVSKVAENCKTLRFLRLKPRLGACA